MNWEYPTASDNDEWIARSCVVIRNGRGEYAFGLRHQQRITRYSREWLVAIKRVRKAAFIILSGGRVDLTPPVKYWEAKPQPKVAVIRFVQPSPERKKKWRRLSGQEMGRLQ